MPIKEPRSQSAISPSMLPDAYELLPVDKFYKFEDATAAVLRATLLAQKLLADGKECRQLLAVGLSPSMLLYSDRERNPLSFDERRWLLILQTIAEIEALCQRAVYVQQCMSESVTEIHETMIASVEILHAASRSVRSASRDLKGRASVDPPEKMKES